MSKNFKYLCRVFLVLLTGAFSPERPEIHAAEEFSSGLEIASAVVGQPTEIRWRLVNGGRGEPVLSRLSLTITQLEKDKRVFFLDRTLTQGDFVFHFHFTDGSQYRVSAVAEIDGRGPLREEKLVTVSAVDPPARAILPALVLFLCAIALGLVAGRASKRPVGVASTRQSVR